MIKKRKNLVGYKNLEKVNDKKTGKSFADIT